MGAMFSYFRSGIPESTIIQVETATPSLQIITLADRQIDGQSSEFQRLILGLHLNLYVTELDLSLNPIGDMGAKFLGEMLRKNKSITKLILHAAQIGDEGAIELAKGLSENECLQLLVLSFNQIGDIGACAFHEILKQNEVLSEIRLTSNLITEDGTSQLAAVCNDLNQDRPDTKRKRVIVDSVRSKRESIRDKRRTTIA